MTPGERPAIDNNHCPTARSPRRSEGASSTGKNSCRGPAKVIDATQVVDDFLISPMTETEKRDLLEVLEDRYGHSSTVVTSQVPTRGWHEALGDPTVADAICDRLVHNAHVIALRGPSMRKKKGMGTEGGSEIEGTKHT